jgi:hypothetical protein
VAAGPLAGEVVQLSLNSRAPVELENDPPSRWIAADSGELFAEQVDGSIEVSGGGTDRFDVVALPIHLAAVDRARGCFSHGV